MHELCKEISDRISQDNADYKLRAEIRKKFKTFIVGNFVMVRIHLKRFPPRTIKKLHARSDSLF